MGTIPHSCRSRLRLSPLDCPAGFILADRSVVARINSDGSIAWEGFTEPAATFTQHFISHPAHS
jgi:hypothetical protein